MRLEQLLPRRRLADSKKNSKKQSTQESKQLKNGWLVVGVAFSVLLMIGLVVADLRLIRDPCVAGKLFPPSGASEGKRSVEDTLLKGIAHDSGETSCHTPPEVTFYTKLSAQDECASEDRDVASEEFSGSVTKGRTKDRGVGIEGDPKGDKKNRDASNANTSSPTLAPRGNLPEPEKGAKVYAVQVGAFTHPAIAQEWALKWKTRGYEVVLKPVARPRTGVIYRLYLGSFSSEKKADELVNRLKSKEGISGFPVVLRN